MSRLTLAPVLALPLLFACASDAPPAPTYTVHVRGTLAQPADLAAAKGTHDGGAGAVEAKARAAGDFAHHVLLGTSHAGTQADEFLAIDQWRGELADVQAFYADPDFQAATGALFAAPPSVRIYERREDWHSWGEAGNNAGPYWFVTVEARLARDTEEANQDAHDTVAAGNEALAAAAGDTAHLPHLAVDDPRTFFNIDVWANEQGMLQTFGDPTFQAQFLSLFEGPPTVRIYRSTDWHQWYQP